VAKSRAQSANFAPPEESVGVRTGGNKNPWEEEPVGASSPVTRRSPGEVLDNRPARAQTPASAIGCPRREDESICRLGKSPHLERF